MMPITNLNKSSFDEFLQTDKIVAVYFWAEWCKPCHAFRHTFEKVAAELTDVAFGTIDVEAEEELSQDFHIRSVPTLVIFRDHVALCMESGALSEFTLRDLIDQASLLDMDEVREKIAKEMLDPNV